MKNKRQYPADLVTSIDFIDESFEEENRPRKKIKPLQ